jgi:hypothetical protein
MGGVIILENQRGGRREIIKGVAKAGKGFGFFHLASVPVSSVQFSSVQFSSNGVPRRSSLPDPSGASDREGTARRNWHGWTNGVGMV